MPSRIALPQPRAARLPRPPQVSLRLVGAVVAAAVVLVGGWMWLRDSSLVRVSQVRVTGTSGFGSAAVRSALDAAARDMTTLNVDEAALRSAVSRYALVRDVQATAHPPHRLDIRVIERVPIGVIRTGGTPTVVADDGTFLRGVPAAALPEIGARVPPGGSRVRDRKTAAKVAVLAEAPAKLRGRILRVTLGRYGLQARLREGLVLRFGDGQRLRAKWLAAQAVMRDPGAAEATYIDLRIPARPAAGGLTELQGGAPQSLTAVAEADAAAVAAQGPATAAGAPVVDPAAATQTDPAVTDPAQTQTDPAVPAVP